MLLPFACLKRYFLKVLERLSEFVQHYQSLKSSPQLALAKSSVPSIYIVVLDLVCNLLTVLLSIPLDKLPCPKLRPPLKLLATAKDNFYGQMSLDNLPSKKCTFGSCFDLSRCPLSSGFPVYFYNNLYGWTSTKVKILNKEVGSNDSSAQLLSYWSEN